MKLKQLLHKRDELRKEWRSVRGKKLEQKNRLLLEGMTALEAREDKYYKQYRKQQCRLSRMIVHVEKKINKKIAGENC